MSTGSQVPMGLPADRELLEASIRVTSPFVVRAREDGTVLQNYFDGHRALGDPHVLRRAANIIAEHLAAAEEPVSGLVGEVSAGAILAAATSVASLAHSPMWFRSCRREPKGYGVSGLLTSELPPGRVAIVDDVAGTGAALARTITAVREQGSDVAVACVLIDRQQGASERIGALGVALHAIFDVSDIERWQPTGQRSSAAHR